MIELHPFSATTPDALETLLDAAFGADRHGRTAYKVRAGTMPLEDLSFVALDDGFLAGSLQSWPLQLTTRDGETLPLAMIGPVAVSPDRQNHGVGRLMLRVAAQRLDLAGLSAMLIGDADYYGPFGFLSGPANGWTLPGPVEPHRILLRTTPGNEWPAAGTLGPDALRSRDGMPSLQA
jgi:predicted N-acetyltransferase YhbS